MSNQNMKKYDLKLTRGNQLVFLTATRTNYLTGGTGDGDDVYSKFSKINPFEMQHKKQNLKIMIGTPEKTFQLLNSINFESPRTEQAIKNLKLHLDVLLPK